MTRADRHDYRMPYADENFGVVDTALFTQEPAPDGGGVIVAGTCPRCH